MNLWNKITLGAKFLFGGWETALDYLLGFLNTYLAKDGVSEKVTKVRETCAWALDWLLKLRVYVPTKWHNEYNAITDVVADVIAVSRDNRITAAEIKAFAASFAEAKKMWDADE